MRRKGLRPKDSGPGWSPRTLPRPTPLRVSALFFLGLFLLHQSTTSACPCVSIRSSLSDSFSSSSTPNWGQTCLPLPPTPVVAQQSFWECLAKNPILGWFQCSYRFPASLTQRPLSTAPTDCPRLYFDNALCVPQTSSISSLSSIIYTSAETFGSDITLTLQYAPSTAATQEIFFVVMPNKSDCFDSPVSQDALNNNAALLLGVSMGASNIHTNSAGQLTALLRQSEAGGETETGLDSGSIFELVNGKAYELKVIITNNGRHYTIQLAEAAAPSDPIETLEVDSDAGVGLDGSAPPFSLIGIAMYSNATDPFNKPPTRLCAKSFAVSVASPATSTQCITPSLPPSSTAGSGSTAATGPSSPSSTATAPGSGSNPSLTATGGGQGGTAATTTATGTAIGTGTGTGSDPAPPPPPPPPPVVAYESFMKIERPFPTTDQEKQNFTSLFITDLAAATNSPPNRFEVISLSPGSTIVQFWVVPPRPDQAGLDASDLFFLVRNQTANRRSPLYAGRVTSSLNTTQSIAKLNAFDTIPVTLCLDAVWRAAGTCPSGSSGSDATTMLVIAVIIPLFALILVIGVAFVYRRYSNKKEAEQVQKTEDDSIQKEPYLHAELPPPAFGAEHDLDDNADGARDTRLMVSSSAHPSVSPSLQKGRGSALGGSLSASSSRLSSPAPPPVPPKPKVPRSVRIQNHPVIISIPSRDSSENG